MNRIVVIEDDPAILRGLEKGLRTESYDVLTAADGHEGYRVVLDNAPDLVILDLTLPGMNGYDICRGIRRVGLATPVLMLTAQDQEMDRVQGFEAGADDYVAKPFSLRELLGRVRAILRRSEGRSDLANQRELDEAREIQQRLMPSELPNIAGMKVAGACKPARLTSGDYFDVLQLGESAIAICIADVCGKGMPAALMMANLQAAVKTCASRRMCPRDLCESVNRLMCTNIARGFITFFYAVIDMHDKTLTFCNSGHNPPLLARDGDELRRLETGGVVLGIFPDWHYYEETVSLASGHRLLLYTDGIIESRNARGQEFGETPLLALLGEHGPIDPATLIQSALWAASEFSNGNCEDDMTAVALFIE